MTFSEIISKFFGGMDKVAHFGIGWAIAGACTTVLVLQNTVIPVSLICLAPIAGLLTVAFLSFCKEVFIDPVFDWKDILVSVLGSVGNYFIWLVAAFFNWLTIKGLNITAIIPLPIILAGVIAFAGWWCKWVAKQDNKRWLNILGTIFYISAIILLIVGIILIFI